VNRNINFGPTGLGHSPRRKVVDDAQLDKIIFTNEREVQTGCREHWSRDA